MTVLADFPAGIITVLKTQLADAPVGPSVTPKAVVGRLLRPTDPDRTIGLSSGDWSPVDYEIGNGTGEPAMARYEFAIQYLVKHVNEEEGRQAHATGSKNIRRMLYRDGPLGVALRGLSDSDGEVTERVLRWGVQRQQFRSNDVKGQFIFVSHLALWVEVEVKG